MNVEEISGIENYCRHTTAANQNHGRLLKLVAGSIKRNMIFVQDIQERHRKKQQTYSKGIYRTLTKLASPVTRQSNMNWLRKGRLVLQHSGQQMNKLNIIMINHQAKPNKRMFYKISDLTDLQSAPIMKDKERWRIRHKRPREQEQCNTGPRLGPQMEKDISGRW